MGNVRAIVIQELPTLSGHMRPGIALHQEEPRAHCTSARSDNGSEDFSPREPREGERVDSTGRMEDSHFNSSYFWSPVPTVQGQIDNTMFLNKMKEQLGPDKNPSFPHSSSHYPTAVLTVPGPVTMDTGATGSRAPKQEGAGGSSLAGGGHLHPPHTSQNITVVSVPSTGIMTAAGLVITTPQGALVSPPSSSPSFVSGPPTTTMIVSALHPPNTDTGRPSPLYLYNHNKKEDTSQGDSTIQLTPTTYLMTKMTMAPKMGANPTGAGCVL
ncbi:hypothetical protein AGOR_G00039660 [Albula goreensis]|uniref:Uncharacterized protein n=1 Tax=Albula goreensis TaxID=1534307 RepID=A0A8T3E119_9TELE|nr:hypothetical protein AGOR_G00039660 [Albula goreensis]